MITKELVIIGSHRLDGYFSYLIYAAIYVIVRSIRNEKIRMYIIRYFTIISTFLCYDLIVNNKITTAAITNHGTIFSNIDGSSTGLTT